MIYTVTLNPSLDHILHLEQLQPGRVNRAKRELLLPGGKGINVSIVLKNLGWDSTALGFCGGFTGAEILRLLRAKGIDAPMIPISGTSRINVKLKAETETEINCPGPLIPSEALSQMAGQMEKLTEGDILVLSGSIPPSLPRDVYLRLLDRIGSKDILLAADATGEALQGLIAKKPFLIKPNHHELAQLFGRRDLSRSDIASCARQLQREGAQNVLVSMAQEGALLACKSGEILELPAPKGTLVNSTGSGDSMVAGFLAGWLETGSLRKAFRMGVAAGSASAFSEYLASGEEIRSLFETI